jgi:hypothetical protein
MTGSKVLYFMCFLMVLLVGAYLLYLAASWNQYQQDRAARDVKINEILDRMPKPKTAQQEAE